MIDSYKATVKKIKPAIKILFTVLFVFLIFSKFDFHTIWVEINKVSLWLYMVPVLGHFVLMAIKSLRWKLLLNSLQINCSYGEALKAYTAGFAFGTFTPGQLGDMGKVMLIENAYGQRKRALIPSFADRLWDLLGLVAVSGGCALFLFSAEIKSSSFILYGLLFCVACLFLTLPIYRFVQKLILSKMEANISKLFVNWHLSFFLTFLALFVQFFRWAVLALAFKLPIFAAASSAMVGTLVALVPISFGGLGTREATIAAVFSYSGLDPVIGISYSFLMFGSYLVGALVGVILLYTYRI